MKSKTTLKKPSNSKKGYLKPFAILFLMLLSNPFVFSQTIVERGGRLQVNGSHVTTENGQKISLAGNSMFWSNAGESEPFYNAQTVNHLTDDWNSTIIRPALGVKESWDGGNNYIQNRAAQTAKIKKVIDAAIAKGIYVIIDWHTHKAENYVNEAVGFFSEMAKTYGEYDNVIYEIYNEPLLSTPWNTVKNYARPVIAAIRANDPDNLIVVGTRTWCQEVEEAADNPINGDPNLAYALHYYANTHGQWLIDRTKRAMQKGAAVFVTEYGTTDASGNGGFNPQESRRWFNFLIENNISYVNWNISDKNEDSSVISAGRGLQGLLDGNLTASGNFVRDHMRSRDYDDITLSTNAVTIDGASVSVFPNPTQGELFIDAPNVTVETVSMYDITGRLVLSTRPEKTDKQIKINLGELSSGNYILKLESPQNSIARKVIKL